jgi:hypothetical protein
LLCADAHKNELTAAGLDPRKAYCDKTIGLKKWELCYDPKKVVAKCSNATVCTEELKVGDVVVNVAVKPQDDGSINVDVVNVGIFKVTSSGIEFLGIMVDGETPKFFLPFPAVIQLTEKGALQLTQFLLLQMQAAVAVTGEGGGRRLDSPGCDLFPDAPCNLGCCAVHDQCYATNGCDAKSWARSICEPILAAGLLSLVSLGPIGTLACATSLLFISGECAQCNNVAVG